MRTDNRRLDQLRPVQIKRHYTKYAEGSVLIEMGNTIVLCNATIEEAVPKFKLNSQEGWVTAEYAMLPRATTTRNKRDISRLKKNARAVEIQRLIGRSLRQAVDMKKLGERQIIVDCDVIQADGGTRTASITGAFVALYDACQNLLENGLIEEIPVKNFVAAVSVGIVDGQTLLDLCYEEDSRADVDMNVVMTDQGEYIELQGTGEENTFSALQLSALTQLADTGIKELIQIQKEALGLV